MVRSRAVPSLTILVVVFCFAVPGMAQSWLKGYQYGAPKVTIPYSVADLEYGKTLKLRIDSDRDWVSAEKLSNKIFGPVRMVGDTYYFGTYMTASVVIKTPEGNIIMNYPWGGDYMWGDKDVSATMIANMEKAGLMLKDIKYFITSESHGDHNAGVAEIIAKTHAKLITMEGDEQEMENQKPIGYPQPKVDQSIKNGFQLKLGGKVLTAYHTGGHTLGATTWMWQEKENGVAYNVANVCCWAMPANVVTNPLFPTETLKQSWEILRSLSVDIPIPGHHPWQFGWFAKMARLEAGEDRLSVFIDPQGYRGFVAVYEKVFRDTLAKQLKEGPPPPGGRGGRGGRGGPGDPAPAGRE
jgi:metallo-beta-lactamase class B